MGLCGGGIVVSVRETGVHKMAARGRGARRVCVHCGKDAIQGILQVQGEFSWASNPKLSHLLSAAWKLLYLSCQEVNRRPAKNFHENVVDPPL